jgi:hypothetical protein
LRVPAPHFILLENLSQGGIMLSIQVRIDRAQRLLRMLEEDAPLLDRRIAELTPEYQLSAKNHAAQLAAHARQELERLQLEESSWISLQTAPQAAD